MTYGEAYLAGWKNIFNYKGVATRSEFWSFMSGSVAICLLPLLCWWCAATIDRDYGVFLFYALPVSFLLTLIFAVPAIALVVRRMHDIGHSGWWFAIVVSIPFTGIFLLIMCCLPSKSQNQA
ncbi:DUF805 domain-containing protein [Escherichia albertii]|uniref:DUF805 domain-containing protein n=2 Tax=Escherichia albertii TaxID=208962 RepID=UPI00107A1718|nr:DUF805 domain-containing protein [Escherichia albertii]EFA6622002.1 DUF805 domain-containing protein [Escherichia albertii]EFA7087325.1 DUF805 domain-containing protein [Escherichia albertii]EFF0830344.1 DUF805 domain-containing protein [Escherichia albertii]EFF1426713.1 DUF805 domain-containing protein [Escherichia albertii]EFL5783948.1 DUF805 domain-containing protein [Escherichia albertii]